MKPILLDEETRPQLRDVIGRLLAAASDASIAVTNVRLALVDLTAAETAGVQRCRILLGRLDARAFDGMAPTPALAPLLRFIMAPHVEIRSIGLSGWSPDFSIYRGLRGTEGPVGDALLVGAHYFREPPCNGGPALTCLLRDAPSIQLAQNRFERLWSDAYDVADTVRATVHSFGR